MAGSDCNGREMQGEQEVNGRVTGICIFPCFVQRKNNTSVWGEDNGD